MEAQDILKMLTNLEQSLQNVESARQQVTPQLMREVVLLYLHMHLQY